LLNREEKVRVEKIGRNVISIDGIGFGYCISSYTIAFGCGSDVYIVWNNTTTGESDIYFRGGW